MKRSSTKQASEMRQNAATRGWVIYAPSRGKRPKDFQAPEKEVRELSAHESGCPFCPGNDRMLPSVIHESKDRKGRWQVRIVPNKFPALTPEGGLERSRQGMYITMPGYGHHEVIIESPLHNRQIGRMSRREVRLIIETYHHRYRELMKKDKNMVVIIFRNHGKRAGTSLVHPHSQLIATGMVPYHIRWREEEAQRYFDTWGRCIHCDMLAHEIRERKRVVYENGTFVAFVPFAAEVPFEVQIVPRAHKADFGDISERERSGLADALRTVLMKLAGKLGDPDYNYVINTSAQYRAREPQLHWHLLLRPRLMTRAGFEIGSGISINPSYPEADAAFLRE